MLRYFLLVFSFDMFKNIAAALFLGFCCLFVVDSVFLGFPGL